MSLFGSLLRVMTFGESHGNGVGCIIEGIPPGLPLTEADVQVRKTGNKMEEEVLVGKSSS